RRRDGGAPVDHLSPGRESDASAEGASLRSPRREGPVGARGRSEAEASVRPAGRADEGSGARGRVGTPARWERARAVTRRLGLAGARPIPDGSLPVPLTDHGAPTR